MLLDWEREMAQIQENNKIPEIIDEFKITTDKIITGVLKPETEIQIKEAGLKIPEIIEEFKLITTDKITTGVHKETEILTKAGLKIMVIVGPKIIITEMAADNLKIQMEEAASVLVVPCEHAKQPVQKFLLVLRVLVNLHVLKDANKF